METDSMTATRVRKCAGGRRPLGAAANLGRLRVVAVAAVAIVLAGCVSDASYNAAIVSLDTEWKAANERTLRTLGKRTVAVSRTQALLAARGATRRIGMLVEDENVETGFLLVTAAAPTPLTAEEWAEVQATDTAKMKSVIAREVGVASWFATLDPSAKDVLANVLVAEKRRGVEVSIGLRLRNKRVVAGRVRRSQPPPTALRIGLRKFWAAFDEELRSLPKSARAPAPAPVPAPVPRPSPSASTPPPASAARNPDGIAVIIGNKDYAAPVPDVDFAHNDADAMKRFVVERLGYRPENVVDLRDAAYADMVSVFGSDKTHKGKLWRWIRPGISDVVVFYSGHGVPGRKNRRGYLLPVDAEPNAPEINGYPVDRLYHNLSRLHVRSLALYMDACFSGDSQGGRLVAGRSGITVAPSKAVQSRLTVITAARGYQVASWDDGAKLGLFTKYLLEALRGAADGARYGNGDGKVTASEVQTYLDREMSYAARRQFGREQNATVAGDLATVLARF